MTDFRNTERDEQFKAEEAKAKELLAVRKEVIEDKQPIDLLGGSAKLFID